MEQRIGRIDRVRSQTDRRLSSLTRLPNGDEKLQVLFPHLQDTVEVLQVRRVLERMDAFLRLMHEGLVAPGREESRIATTKEFDRIVRAPDVQTQALKSSFPVRAEHLVGQGSDVASVVMEVEKLEERFVRLRDVEVPNISIMWEATAPPGSLKGTAHLLWRIQPFAIFLDLYGLHPRIRCVSPLGRVRPGEKQDKVVARAWPLGARLGAILDEDSDSYELRVEEDVLLAPDPSTDGSRFASLLQRVLAHTDQFAHEFLPQSVQPIADFRADLQEQLVNGR